MSASRIGIDAHRAADRGAWCVVGGSRCVRLALGALLIAVMAETVQAQPLVIDPSGPSGPSGSGDSDSASQPAGQPGQPGQSGQSGPTVRPVPVGARADGTINGDGEGRGASDAAADLGQYHTDDLDGLDAFFGQNRPDGGLSTVASHHVVRSGDTLWDICWFYFNSPWEWPKIWSYNPHITNPHWIYPGDLVRLYPKGLEPTASTSENVISSLPGDVESPDDGIQPTPARQYGIKLRQTAFVEQDKLDFAATIVGAVDEKTMLSYGDEVYLEYRGDPPKVGERFAIYTKVSEVAHPKKKKTTAGAYVKILGELRIESVKQGKRPRAVITDSVDVIERGALVGPLQRTYRTVEPQRNDVDLQGTIVAMLEADQLIGQGQLIFIDQGRKHGVKVGNRLFVVRRGDAYEELKRPDSDVGQDDRRFPARAIGEIVVVQAGEQASVAMVTLALQEIGVGDLVLMRKARAN